MYAVIHLRLKPEKEQPELRKQIGRNANNILNDLNKECSWGCKKNSQGNVFYWKGYKFHLDVSDIGFPLTVCVTGANVHDGQVAIPFEKLTGSKGKYFYSVMDSAYDAKWIQAYIRMCRRVPIIDPNTRRNKNRPSLDPAKQERYKIRTSVERALRDGLAELLTEKNIQKISVRELTDKVNIHRSTFYAIIQLFTTFTTK